MSTDDGNHLIDIMAQLQNGQCLLLTYTASRSLGAIVAEAVWAHYRTKPYTLPSAQLQVRHVWLCGANQAGYPRLLEAWPCYDDDPRGHLASVAAWKAAPCGAGGELDAAVDRERVLVVGSYADDCRAAQAAGLSWEATSQFFMPRPRPEPGPVDDFDPFFD